MLVGSLEVGEEPVSWSRACWHKHGQGTNVGCRLSSVNDACWFLRDRAGPRHGQPVTLSCRTARNESKYWAGVVIAHYPRVRKLPCPESRY